MIFVEVVGSLKKEGFGIVPDVTWDDIGALDHVRKKLQNYMVCILFIYFCLL